MQSGNDESTTFYENLDMQSGMTEMSPVSREVTIEMLPVSRRMAIEISQVRREGPGEYCLKHTLYSLNIQSVIIEMSPVRREMAG